MQKYIFCQHYPCHVAKDSRGQLISSNRVSLQGIVTLGLESKYNCTGKIQTLKQSWSVPVIWSPGLAWTLPQSAWRPVGQFFFTIHWVFVIITVFAWNLKLETYSVKGHLVIGIPQRIFFVCVEGYVDIEVFASACPYVAVASFKFTREVNLIRPCSIFLFDPLKVSKMKTVQYWNSLSI